MQKNVVNKIWWLRSVSHMKPLKYNVRLNLIWLKLLGGKSLTQREITPPPTDEEIEKRVEELGADKVLQVAKSFLAKHDRKDQFSQIKEEIIETFTTEKGEEYMEENGKFGERIYRKNEEKGDPSNGP